MDEKKLKILVSAYACEPHKGSEPGIGWNWAKQITKFAEVWVITRLNNKKIIEEELSKIPEPNLHFVYTDLPKWISFWKKGQRGARLYYFFWRFFAYFLARKLSKEIKFNLAHHITFGNELPSLLGLLPMPFIWGPIGSNTTIPGNFLFKFSYLFNNRLNHFIRLLIRTLDPLFLITFMKSRKIILYSKNQLKVFPFWKQFIDKFIFQLAISIDTREITFVKKDISNHIKIYSAGALIPIKGFHLSVLALAEAYQKNKEIILRISGEGFVKKFIVVLIKRLNLEDKVIFTGKLERTKILELMQDSDIFLFPSFEGGGMVVLEAMAAGLPVVCLDYGGPGEMVTEECGIKVKPITPEQTIKDLADALLRLANDPDLRKKMGEAGRKRVQEFYTWEKKGEFIKRIYQEVLAGESPSNS